MEKGSTVRRKRMLVQPDRKEESKLVGVLVLKGSHVDHGAE